jgi:hypothetical protein
MMMMITIEFCVELNSQGPIAEPAGVENSTSTCRQKQTSKNKLNTSVLS